MSFSEMLFTIMFREAFFALVVIGALTIMLVILTLVFREDKRLWEIKGFCLKCGYDWQGLPKCPECGEERVLNN